MVIAANQDTVFKRLCAALGRPGLAEEPRFATHVARGEHQEEIEDVVREWAAQRTAAEIDRVLGDAGVICGPIYSVADMFADEHFWAREMLLRHEDPRPRAPSGGPAPGARASTTPRSTAASSASTPSGSRRSSGTA
jgi:formyl-CoA transferase